MSAEILAVPEDYLAEVIKVIRSGLAATEVDPEVVARLNDWCDDETEYLRTLSEDA